MLIDGENIASLAAILHEAGQKIVFTNGCFDIIHAGHVRYLAKARALGDCLVVGLNSDSSVRRLKGEGRPVNCEADRAEVLSALAAVDYVVLFGEQTAEGLVGKIKPDVYVKGGDYNLNNLPEADVVKSYGGRVELVPLVKGRSTTGVINRIKENSEGA